MGMARPPRSGPASADRTAVARSGYRTRSGTLHTADEAESYSFLSVCTTHKTYFFVEQGPRKCAVGRTPLAPYGTFSLH